MVDVDELKLKHTMPDRLLRRRNSLLLITAIFVALYLPPLTSFIPGGDISIQPSNSISDGGDYETIPNDEEIDLFLELALPVTSESLAPYNLEDVLKAVDLFQDTFAVVVYDPDEDTFIAYYSKNHKWVTSIAKLISSFKVLANSLRVMFPERFQPWNPEFAVAISSGDYPSTSMLDCIRSENFPCVSEDEKISPIFHFGSVFREEVIPSMIAMPMPQSNHLLCYHNWALHGKICNEYLAKGPGNPTGLVFAETVGIDNWDDLIPSVVWRGTDFSYLTKMRTTLRKPDFQKDIKSKLNKKTDQRIVSVRSMRRVYDQLIPRWKGVVWTAEAELELKQKGKTDEIPWANMKFSSCMHDGKKTPVGEVDDYKQYEAIGIPLVGDEMSLEELSRYKYHIDLGGGGGTTWSGTLSKLGLPGLLFHHSTPTKDYLHDKMTPWVHYVPVREDLKDLRAKFVWAERHPALAKRISTRATMLARSLGTDDGMAEMYHEFYEGPLRRAVEAYQAVPHGSWRPVMENIVGDDLIPVIKCDGQFLNKCHALVTQEDGFKHYGHW